MPTIPRRPLAFVAGLTALAAVSLPAVDADLLGTAADVVDEAFAPQLVTVTADLAQRNAVASSGLDVTEHAGHDYVEVVLHSPLDLAVLESLGLRYQVRIPDLLAREQAVNLVNRTYAAAVDTSPLPSGRTTYRMLEDYEADMRRLAAEHPDIVRLVELPHQTIEGKTVLAVEIASDVQREDGRPTMAIMGLHHAREWPSGENTMEFAFDLAQNHGTDARITRLLNWGRVLVIPVVNPDGFQKSIESGMLVDLRALNEYDPLDGTASILLTPGNAYKRKNCGIDGVPSAPLACDLAASPGGYGIGVDLNRNYGTFHGGPGTDPGNPASPVYPGPEGFSEPETQNIRDLVSSRHVTMLITNHTFGNLLLRPNGVNPTTLGPDGVPVGDSPDEAAMADLGERMVANNGYSNQHGWQLYDTTGTTEDWSYNSTGGYGYTFEIGPNEFHPPFPEVIDEYLGAGEYAGKGNREAYLVALETAIDNGHHSVLVGDASPGATLTLTRSGAMPTWTGSFAETISTSLTVPANGKVEWHVNPSTRPIVKSKQYETLEGPPVASETRTLAAPVVGSSLDVPWTVTQSSDLARVRLDWATPDDFDLEVFRTAADGSLESIGSSGNLPGEKEVVQLADLEPGEYVIRVINYLAIAPEVTVTTEEFDARTETTIGLVEAWTLTCEVGGEVVATRPVIIDRGQVAKLDLPGC